MSFLPAKLISADKPLPISRRSCLPEKQENTRRQKMGLLIKLLIPFPGAHIRFYRATKRTQCQGENTKDLDQSMKMYLCSKQATLCEQFSKVLSD